MGMSCKGSITQVTDSMSDAQVTDSMSDAQVTDSMSDAQRCIPQVPCCLAQQLAGKHRLSQTAKHCWKNSINSPSHPLIGSDHMKRLAEGKIQQGKQCLLLLSTYNCFQWQANQQLLETKATHLAILSKGVTTSRDLLKALSRKALGRRSMTSLAESMASAACSRKGLTKFSTDALMALLTAVCT